jgi:hypothetical protein
MTRRHAYFGFFTLTLIYQLKEVMQYGQLECSLWLAPFVVMESAAVFPGAAISVMLENFGIFLPFHDAVLISLAIWFFPVARIERWAGSFDAFAKAGRGRSHILSAWAKALDFNDRRKFGTTKTGGWA